MSYFQKESPFPGADSQVPCFSENYFPSRIKWDRTSGLLRCDRAIGYSGLGVHSVGPVGDFLDMIYLYKSCE